MINWWMSLRDNILRDIGKYSNDETRLGKDYTYSIILLFTNIPNNIVSGWRTEMLYELLH